MRFHVNLTERGRDLRWFPAVGAGAAGEALGHLPTLAVGARPEQPKPLAVVLATSGSREGEPAGDPDPVVSFQPYGGGRVVVIEGAGMWRWAFLPPQQQQYDDVYRAMWHGLIRWLVSSAGLLPGQPFALRGDKLRFQPGESAAVTLLARDEAVKAGVPGIELHGDGTTVARVVQPIPLGDEPGTFRVVFGSLAGGPIRSAGGRRGERQSGRCHHVRGSEFLGRIARPHGPPGSDETDCGGKRWGEPGRGW